MCAVVLAVLGVPGRARLRLRAAHALRAAQASPAEVAVPLLGLVADGAHGRLCVDDVHRAGSLPGTRRFTHLLYSFAAVGPQADTIVTHPPTHHPLLYAMGSRSLGRTARPVW
ncbi:hypothetical protein ACIHCX_37565 [Streptomyces sp. NPDC052043]|uniref:hypothetical protein n=1 Tax=Streptomyces sp. NPDC052043 TaxID=3365684 RepID=UPI0037D06A83